MSLRPLLPLLLLCACQSGSPTPDRAPSAAVAAPAPVPVLAPEARLLERSQSDNRVMQHLRHQTKEIGPRLTGSEHYDRAAQWCLAQFQSWGLAAHLETWGEFPVRCDRGVQRGHEVAPQTRDLAFLTRAWSRGTQGSVRARAALEPADEAELEAHKQDYAGKWLFRLPKRPPAALRKALDAVLEAHPPAGIVRSFGGELLQMGGTHTRSLEEIEKQKSVEILLRGDQYDEIVAGLKEGHQVELEFGVENKLVAGPVPCTNVVAAVPTLVFTPVMRR